MVKEISPHLITILAGPPGLGNALRRLSIKMLLSIIVINYQTADLTISCLKSIIQKYPNEIGKHLEVIVLDNGSADNSYKKIKQFIEGKRGMKLLSSNKNIGFGAGCNLAVGNAEGEIVLFLNSDAEIGERVFEAVEYLRNQQSIAILGGKIINDDGSVERSAGNFYNLLNIFFLTIGAERLGLVRKIPKETEIVDWVSGGCFFIKKKVFSELSGFDENYFMYLEDMDLCLRAKKSGYDTFYFPSFKILHKKHGSSSREFAIFNIYKSLLQFYKKNKSSIEYNIARLLLLLKAVAAVSAGKLFRIEELLRTYGQTLSLFK